MSAVTDHNCMVVTRKQNLLVIEKVLKSLSITNIIAPNSFREVTELSVQYMPHIILLESDLPDCSTMTILTKLKLDPLFDKTQFIVVRKFTREEIMKCMELKVAGMLQQPLDTTALTQKLKTVVTALKGGSPYSVSGDGLPGGKTLSVKSAGRFVSVQDDFFTVESGLDVAPGKQISIRPMDPTKAPLKATCSGLADPDESKPHRQFLFSFDSATGRGREWLQTLRQNTSAPPMKKVVLLFESNPTRGAQLRQMLNFYEIEVNLVPSFEKLRLIHEAQKDKHRVVYLCEPPLHASGIAWDKYWNSLQPNDRPIQLIATTSMNNARKPGVQFLKMPFGLDALVESFETAFAQVQLGSTAGTGILASVPDLPFNFTFFADLVHIDERGAVIDSPHNFPVNARLNLVNPVLSIINLSSNVRVAATRPLDAARTKFRTRITNLEGQVSIGRYWKPLAAKLEQLTAQAGSDNTKSAASGDAA